MATGNCRKPILGGAQPRLSIVTSDEGLKATALSVGLAVLDPLEEARTSAHPTAWSRICSRFQEIRKLRHSPSVFPSRRSSQTPAHCSQVLARSGDLAQDNGEFGPSPAGVSA
jgi:hypothetical protein